MENQRRSRQIIGEFTAVPRTSLKFEPPQTANRSQKPVIQVERRERPITDSMSVPPRPIISQRPKPTEQPQQKVEQQKIIEPKPVLQNPIIQTENRSRIKQLLRPQVALITIAVLIFGLGASLSIAGYKKNKQVDAQVQSTTQNNGSVSTDNSIEQLDETEPGNINNYVVNADVPKIIKITKIGLNAPINLATTDANGGLKAPNNIFYAGWYEFSGKLGAPGATLLTGYESGPTKPGIFSNTKNLVEGDIIEIERGDGQKFKYKIIKTENYDTKKDQLSKALTPIQTGVPGLNIIVQTTTGDSTLIFASMVI